MRFGSVGGGGRYDGLVGALPRRACSGDRLLHRRLAAALGASTWSRARSRRATRTGPGRGAGDGQGPKSRRYQRMVTTLRQAGIRAEFYLGSSGMKAQMKYADKRNSPCVVIQGSNERERGRSRSRT